MRFKYFGDVATAEEGKALYRDLLKKYHPDNGIQDDTIIKEINAEFSEWWKVYKSRHAKEKEAKKVFDEDISRFMGVLQKIIHLPVVIEICGYWVWVTGNTYPYREALKEVGFKWSASKKAWYWAEDLTNVKYRGRKTLKQIRFQYGSQKVDTSPIQGIE